MVPRKFSDRVYTTLLWEFSKFAKQKVWDTGFVEQTLQMLQQTGELSPEDARTLLGRRDVVETLQVGSAGLFVDFLLANPEILGEQELLRWVQTKQSNYPLP
jgi:hypothetical protein